MGNETSFIITHPENISAVAGLSINNNPKANIPITNGHASADLNLDIGSYVATITTPDIVYYTDSGRNLTCTYLSATTTSNEFKVSRKADVELNVKDIVYGENEPINVNIDAEGNVTIILDGRTVKDALVINNKEINYTIPERYLNAGRHTVEVIYNGDTYVFASSKTAQFTVNKTNSILSASSLATIYNGGKYLVATLKDNAGKPIDGVNVQINLNGIVHDKITDKNGEVKLSTDALAPKTYSAIISFAGNANYVKSTKTVSVEVTKAAPKLFASIKSFKKSAKTKKYAVLLKSNQNRVMGNAWVTLKVNKKTYKVKTDKYGKATFKITSLKKKGKYGATVRFAGNAYYKAVTKKAKITIR